MVLLLSLFLESFELQVFNLLKVFINIIVSFEINFIFLIINYKLILVII